ncbi:hypothetical protein M404DRAFT_1008160 [Pisolithus tinctorius Marx 270]|uniref:Uncharacterized protein n=1 Tax=Pisolithus tinctorius Marx 270 TaxID=870435 RepID=A0A0C3JAI9_PISTI|nr:hypothetical protein M404DRAFT_1008160 [Pisolithus tinctorius Marx 270]
MSGRTGHHSTEIGRIILATATNCTVMVGVASKTCANTVSNAPRVRQAIFQFPDNGPLIHH